MWTCIKPYMLITINKIIRTKKILFFLITSNIHKGYYNTDAVRVDQVLKRDFSGEFYNADYKPIRHIKPGTQHGDAITYEQAIRLENNELYWYNSKIDLYFIDSKVKEVRVYIYKK